MESSTNMKYPRIEIIRCSKHGVLALSIEHEYGNSERITPCKCCGSWETVCSWSFESIDLITLGRMIHQLQNGY
jgi:hypothetical protein